MVTQKAKQPVQGAPQHRICIQNQQKNFFYLLTLLPGLSLCNCAWLHASTWVCHSICKSIHFKTHGR